LWIDIGRVWAVARAESNFSPDECDVFYPLSPFKPRFCASMFCRRKAAVVLRKGYVLIAVSMTVHSRSSPYICGLVVTTAAINRESRLELHKRKNGVTFCLPTSSGGSRHFEKGKGGRQYIAYAHNELYAFVLPEKKRLTTII